MKMQLKDKRSILKTFITPLRWVVSTRAEQFHFLMACCRIGREMIQIIHLSACPFNPRHAEAFKGSVHISGRLNVL